MGSKEGGGVVGVGVMVDVVADWLGCAMNFFHQPIVGCVLPCPEYDDLVEIGIHEIADSPMQAPPCGVEPHPLHHQTQP